MLSEFCRTLVGDYSVPDVLRDVAELAAALLPIDGAGVSLADENGKLGFVAASDETIQHIERLQAELGDGPCQRAYATDERLVIPDLAECGAWPAFREGALAAGLRGLASFPLSVDAQPIGSLDVYRRQTLQLDETDLEVGDHLANMATSYVIASRRQASANEQVGQLRHALTHRVVVEQAKGVLVGRHQITFDQALEAMRRHARDRNLTLRQVARDVLDGSLDPMNDATNAR